MPSTYSSLKFELIGTGEQDGTWGDTTNTNLGTAIEQAITGSGSVTFSSSDVTLTLANSNTAQTARNLRLVLVGTSDGARQLIVPAIEKQYIVKNELADAVTIKNSTGTGITIPAGKTMTVFNDATNVVDVTTYATSLTVGGNVAITGNLNVSGTMTAPSPQLTGTPTAPTAPLGTNTTQIATTAFVLQNAVPTGSLVMWSTDVAPSGWLICDGSSVSTTTYAALYAVIGYTFGGSGGNFSLPDYRNRFPIGAGDSYVIGGTGGSKDAIVVSHSHTASVTDPGHKHLALDPEGGTVQTYGIPATGGPGAPVYASIPNNNFQTGRGFTGLSVTNSTTGSSGTNANLPPYLGIRFIIKT